MYAIRSYYGSGTRSWCRCLRKGWSECSGWCRITSYNVCYTKLLRTHFDGLFPTPLAENVRSVHGKLDFQFWLERKPGAWQDGLLTLGQNQLNWQQQETEHSLAMQGGDVITSYSIHYTKLYDCCHSPDERWRDCRFLCH